MASSTPVGAAVVTPASPLPDLQDPEKRAIGDDFAPSYEDEVVAGEGIGTGIGATDGASSINSEEDLLAQQDLDPVLNIKMHLVNNVSAP